MAAVAAGIRIVAGRAWAYRPPLGAALLGALIAATVVQWTMPLLPLAGDQANTRLAMFAVVVCLGTLGRSLAARIARWSRDHAAARRPERLTRHAVGPAMLVALSGLGLSVIQLGRSGWADRLAAVRATAATTQGVTEALWLGGAFALWLFQPVVLMSAFVGLANGIMRGDLSWARGRRGGTAACGTERTDAERWTECMSFVVALACVPVVVLPDVGAATVDGWLAALWLVAAAVVAFTAGRRGRSPEDLNGTAEPPGRANAVGRAGRAGTDAVAPGGAVREFGDAPIGENCRFVAMNAAVGAIQVAVASSAALALLRLAAQWTLAGVWMVYAWAAGLLAGMVCGRWLRRLGAVRGRGTAATHGGGRPGADARRGSDGESRDGRAASGFWRNGRPVGTSAQWLAALCSAWPALLVMLNAGIVTVCFAIKVHVADAVLHQLLLVGLVVIAAMPLGFSLFEAGQRSARGWNVAWRSRLARFCGPAVVCVFWIGGLCLGHFALSLRGPGWTLWVAGLLGSSLEMCVRMIAGASRGGPSTARWPRWFPGWQPVAVVALSAVGVRS
ncbi:MAG: hypothetical protein D6725_12050, partial [Planctomycetota bacterium]